MVMLYFSATGNSKYIAELFCVEMRAECRSIEDKADFNLLITSEEIVGFCYPIYGSRVPRLMREFVSAHMDLLKSKKLIIFCTQMAFSGDGARVLTDLFPRRQAKVIYAEHFLMPNNVCNLSIMPLAGEKTTRWYLSKSRKKMRKVCDNIKNGKVKKRGFSPGSRMLGLIQGVFLPGIERRAATKVWIDGDCSKCHLCVSICPMDNFSGESGEIKAKGNCMMCYRCLNKCPQKAITVSIRKKVKKQYEMKSPPVVLQ